MEWRGKCTWWDGISVQKQKEWWSWPLRIGRIIDKNRSLLAKWVWRFGKEDTSLWRRGTKTASILEEGLSVIVGKGDKARFWKGILSDSTPLQRAFSRIFALAVDLTTLEPDLDPFSYAFIVIPE
ncbi:hypothetical protein Dsin_009678 [Dipteronia sinensis]|uniref:Reverse transcriptase zinc-binding domain-containing protein n=1 Tax=Dipteronia sinensis TaxID=43782 RepID=A0AAE0EBV3_9ROSI|nr:hypothetical protein Dsin_009678 [Dipteronia sinensis]